MKMNYLLHQLTTLRTLRLVFHIPFI